MKAFIHFNGDSSVGLRSFTLEAEIEADFQEESEREEARKLLTDCYKEIHGEDCWIHFSDECPECGGRHVSTDCKYLHT